MTYSFTTIVSEDAPIEISALLILDKDEPFYDMPSLNFKSPTGKELESWDSEGFLLELYQHLSLDNQTLVDFIDNADDPDNSIITSEYVLDYKAEILELFELAFKIGMMQKPNPIVNL